MLPTIIPDILDLPPGTTVQSYIQQAWQVGSSVALREFEQALNL